MDDDFERLVTEVKRLADSADLAERMRRHNDDEERR